MPQEAKPKIAANLSAADLQAVVGQYNMGNGLTMSVTVESGHIFFETAGRRRFEIFPESDRDFFVESGAAQATFVRNAKNQVAKAILKQAGDRIDAPKITGK